MFAILFAASVSAVAIGGPAQPTSVADPRLTPGAFRTDLTLAQICATKWGEDRRAVTAAMKRTVFVRYGFAAGNADPRCTHDAHGRACEIDHRGPRCLGGADVVENLSPQPYGGPWNAHMKDRVETQACKAICAPVKPLDLAEARQIFLGDWRDTYRSWFGDPPTH